ncbi:MAG: Ig-like domain-containing protein [bacterium]|nr:Ig-like domain-containing protein [bacterium]
MTLRLQDAVKTRFDLSGKVHHTLRMKWFFLFLFLPISWASAEGLNTGFVEGVWYSKTPFFAGETIRMYTAVQNNSSFDIQGTVEFLIDGTGVGQSSFSATNGRIVEVWNDWNVTKGNHSIGAQIKEVFKVEIGKDPEPITLGTGVLGVSDIFADVDTDQDGIGDLLDLDDDNDLVTDIAEKTLGTDPSKSIKEDPLLAKEPDLKSKISVVTEITEKVIEEYLPTATQKVDSFMEATTEKLTAQRQELKEKKESFNKEEPLQPLPLTDQALDLFLASAIVALPQWQIGLFLFFAIAAALLLRRLTQKEPGQE